MNTKNLIKPAIIAALCTSLSINATQPQADPDNPNGYILAKTDILASEQAKTQNPMYETWSKALRTQSNTIVNAITPNSSANPENVRRAE